MELGRPKNDLFLLILAQKTLAFPVLQVWTSKWETKKRKSQFLFRQITHTLSIPTIPTIARYSIYLPEKLSVRLSVRPSVRLFVRLFVRPSVRTVFDRGERETWVVLT